MKIRSRVTTAVTCVAAALAAFSAASAHADSAVGVDTTLGNVLSPAYPGEPTLTDPDAARDERTPTGRLYKIPYAIPDDRPRTAEGWFYSGAVEIGGLWVTGDKKALTFREHQDLKNGVYVPYFRFEADNPDNAGFVELFGGGVGYDEQFYGARFGRYNDWRIRAFYNETPHLYTTTYRSLWSGVGTDNLTLNTLTPGGSPTAAETRTNILNALKTIENSYLGVVRKKGGLGVDVNLSPSWKAYVNFTAEKKQGSRPFGAVWGGGGGGGNAEIPESIDYNTYDIYGGLRYTDSMNSFNLQAQATLFRNNIGTMSFDNPLTITTNTIQPTTLANTFTYGRYDLYPDNDYYNVKGEYARALPDLWNGRFTAVVSLGRTKQNDNLIAPTPFPLTGVTINGVSAANVWNTTNALTRQSSGAQIDSTLIDVGLTVNPAPAWSLRGKFRYFDTDNSTEYLACNPLTGQWGRLTNEGSGGSFVSNAAYNATSCNLAAVEALNQVPSAGNVNIKSVPYDGSQLNYSLAAEWRINGASNLDALFERQEEKPNHRERDKITEDRFRLGYVNRGLPNTTLRLSYEYAHRTGSTYHPDPYEEYYSVEMGPLPTATGTNVTSWIHVLNQFRKYDMADRDQNTVNARLNYIFSDELDGGVSLQYKDARYPDSEYGRNGHLKQWAANVDLNWQPTDNLGMYGFYSYQSNKMEQLGLQQNACAIGTTYYFWSNGQVTTTAAPPAGTTLVTTSAVTGSNWPTLCGNAAADSPLYPTSRSWYMQQNSTDQAVGAGVKYQYGKTLFDIAYTFIDSRTKIPYTYNPAALGMTPTQVALAGSGFPDLIFRRNIVDANVLVPISKTIGVRLYYRYENGKTNDWHYGGVEQNPMPTANTLYLDSGSNGSEKYNVNVFGAFLRVAL